MLEALMAPGTLLGVMFIINFAFQGMGKGMQSFILAAGRQGLIYLPLLIIMDKFVGLNGIIWAQPTADFCCIVLSAVMFFFTMKKLIRNENATKSSPLTD